MPTGGDHVRFGRFGEDAAAEHYQTAGYRILARNWRGAGGEIDLVVDRGDTVVFVEVKSRSSNRFGTGAEAVDRRKQARIRSVALQWLSARSVDGPRDGYDHLRFDVVDVDRRGTLVVHEGCF